ncbi:Metalloprotease [Irpex rosettiformis]|uniref:Metalloprotease n=1 Tax=Irpex rosettiformis TaxID=378272 RepID=A0ACB8UH14_9APHY|nr:Metalloprotease [Irpex rosettiformis]
MTDGRVSRPSTDEESAPLLQDVAHPDETRVQNGNTFSERVSSVVQEPLTPFTKILLVLLLILLLLSSVFIGLFAGAQHKLNSRKGGGQPGTTATFTATVTVPVTTTAVSTTISATTSFSTSTAQSTTTVIAPAPVPTDAPEERACFSSQCVKLAASVISSLDESNDPCENFYDFANGGWLKEHPIPSDKGRFGNFDALSQQNRRLIQQILSQDSSSLYLTAGLVEGAEDPYDTAILKKLRGFYSSCMNEDLLDARGADPLLHIVRNIRKLFEGEERVNSIQDDKQKQRKGLTAAVAYLHTRGITALFDTDIEGDAGKDPNDMTLWFSQPSLGLPAKEYYEEESVVEVYTSTLERLLIAIADEDEKLQSREFEPFEHTLTVHEDRLRVWPPWPWPPWDPEDPNDPDHPGSPHKPINRTKEAHKLAVNIIEFEKKIANVSLDPEVISQDPIGTYNPVPISNLTDSLPEISFHEYFASFTPRNYPARVILLSTTYPAALSSILSETRREVLEAYLETRAALELSKYLGYSTEAWKATRVLTEKLTGIKSGAVGDRAEFCVSSIENALGFAAGRYFVKEVFGGDSREKGTRVITDIVKAFKKSLDNVKWMDDNSTEAAQEKADSIRVKVGFPLSPDTRNPRSIYNYYGRVQGQETTYFENVVSAWESDVYWKWQKLGKRRDPEAWEMYPSQVNAYYNPPANEIVFPAGILQPPFFSKDWPGYMSYGSFGQVAAHELTHAFDSAGRLYNQQGKLEQWWTNATSERFLKLQTCIVDQYSKYTIDDGKGGKVHVNGNLTSGENIGDTGLIQSYRAWKVQFNDSYKAGNEYLLPGLNYTRDQLFFISFARAWAENIKPESAVARVRTDPHSPNRYRVDGTVYNIPEFAKAFKCSSKAKVSLFSHSHKISH